MPTVRSLVRDANGNPTSLDDGTPSAPVDLSYDALGAAEPLCPGGEAGGVTNIHYGPDGQWASYSYSPNGSALDWAVSFRYQGAALA